MSIQPDFVLRATSRQPSLLNRFRSEGWWRRGESNPRPKALHLGFYMLSRPIGLSNPGTPAGGLSWVPASLRLVHPGRKRCPADQPVVGASSGVQAPPGRHGGLSRQRQFVVGVCRCSACFTRWTDLGMPPKLRQPPSKPCRPRSYRVFRFMARSMSRRSSRFLIAWRLSYLRFPRARPSSTLARPALK